MATLNGSNSQSISENGSYFWNQTAGQDLVIYNSDRAVATVEASAIGTYTFELTVTEGENIDSDSITLKVVETPVKGCAQIHTRSGWILALCAALVAWRRQSKKGKSCQRYSATNVEN